MFRVRPNLLAALPAGIVLLAAAGVWGALGARLSPGELAGWLMLLMMMGTVAGIGATGALARPMRALVILAVVLAVLVAAGSGATLGIMPVVGLVCLMVVWMLLWCAVTRLLAPWGPGVGMVAPLTLSALCMASPVALMPLVHAATHCGHAGSLVWQERVVELIRHACPFLAILDVMPPAGMGGVRSNWATLPAMYKWSGLGQEVPMLLPNIWTCVGIYAALAVLAGLPLLWRGRRKAA